MPTHINITSNGYPQSSDWYFWYPPSNAFDGSTESLWQSSRPCSISDPVWISYYWVSNSFKLSKYQIHVNGSQRPISWTLQGSNDGSAWNDIDVQSSQTGNLVEWMSYEVTTNQYYNYFRLYITESSDPSLPVKINEIQFFSLNTDTTTSTSTATTTSTLTTISQTTVTTSLSTTVSTTSTLTTNTTTTTFSTTTLDNTLLWQPNTPLDDVRDNINDWYKSGISVALNKLEELPVFTSNSVGVVVYITSEDKYYIGTQQGWELLHIGNVPHAPHHATHGDDELIHLGSDVPVDTFQGKVWIYTDFTVTTTTTTATTQTTTTLTSSSSTQTTTTTYTYTTILTTTTTYTTTTSTSITSPNYLINILTNSTVTADSSALGFDAFNVIDDLDWSKWLTNPTDTLSVFPHWIKFVLPQPRAARVINILWDYARYSDNWYIEGSNDGLIWDILYHKYNYTPVPTIYNEHIFSNATEYTQYRIRFIAGKDTRTNSVGVFGIQLLADAYPTTTSTTTQSSTTTTATTLSTTTTEPLGYVNVAPTAIVLSNNEYAGYPASNVVDENEFTSWICDPLSGPPYWIMVYWPDNRQFTVDQYYLYINSLGRPRDWKLQGSNNGSNWDTLDEQVDIEVEGWWASVIPNENSYSYYRLLIERTQSTGYSVRVGAMELWINQNYRFTTTTTTTTQTTTVTTTLSTTLTSTTVSTSFSTTPPAPVDLKFLMNFNGVEGSTQSVDDTGKHRSITWLGNASITNSKFKYGTGSLLLPYNSYYPNTLELNSYIEIPNSYSWQLGNGDGDFTVDFWVQWITNNYLYMNWNNLITYFKDIDNYWSIRYYPNGNILGFALRQNGLLSVAYNSPARMQSDWNYICLVRLNNLLNFYLNGQYCDGGKPCDITFPYFESGVLWIGQGPSEYLNTSIDYTSTNCYLDGLRVNSGALFFGPMQLPPEPSTSTTVSTTTTVTTTTSFVSYAPRLILACNTNDDYLTDLTGRHGIISLQGSGTTSASRFATYTDRYVYPLFDQPYLFSGYTDPYDYRSGIAGYLEVADSDSWCLGDDGLSDFTVDGWLVYRYPYFEYGTPILSHYQDSNNFWAIYVSYGSNQFLFKVRSDGSSLIEYSAPIIYQNLNWNYFSLNRSNGRIRVFWNGDVNGYWIDYSNITIPNFVGSLFVFGGPNLLDYSEIVAGGVASQGIRITKGIIPGSTTGVIPSASF